MNGKLTLSFGITLIASVSTPAIAQSLPADTAVTVEQIREELETRKQRIGSLEQELQAEYSELDSLERRLENVEQALSLEGPERPARQEEMESTPPSLLTDLIPGEFFDRADAEGPLLGSGLTGSSRATTTLFGLSAGGGSGRASIAVNSSDFRAFNPTTGADCTFGSGDYIPPVNDCQNSRYERTTTTVTLSTPLAKSGETSFATLDGLATGTKVEFRRTFFGGTASHADLLFNNSSVRDAQERCQNQNRGEEIKCARIDNNLFEDYMTAAEREDYARAVYQATLQGSDAFTVAGSIGYEEFELFPSTDFQSQDAERVSFSAGAGYLYFPSHHTSMVLEGQYQRTFKAADSETRCRPLPDPGDNFLTCATGAFSEPESTDKLILASQFRQIFPLAETGLIRDIAIAPRVEFDALSDDYAVDVPIYFARNTKSGLVAGIRVGFEETDGDGDFKIGVFYGQAFDLTPF